jgi:hypothetical protein
VVASADAEVAKDRFGSASARRSGVLVGREAAPCGAGARAVAALLDGFKRHDLLTYASAISFQILTAIIPFLLFVLGLAGSLHLNYVWRDHLEPQLRGDVSSAVFAVIENAVNNVFASRQVLWATVGGGLALWLFAAGFGRVALGRETPESRILIWAHRLRRADRPRVSG